MKSSGKIISKSLLETEQFAQSLKGKLAPRAAEATILALSGDLGSGKTAFVKLLAKTYGVSETVTSPTFVIEKVYKLEVDMAGQNFSHLIHIDAYRLESADQLAKLGWKQVVEDPKNLICIEWPEKVEALIPSSAKWLKFTFVDEQTREIEEIQETK
jgi:tRNA threonylcarbamoyladenosine biosynthesis protein TsaE